MKRVPASAACYARARPQNGAPAMRYRMRPPTLAAYQAVRPRYLGRVQVAKAVQPPPHPGNQMHTPRLQQAHDAQHVQTLRRTQNVGRIGHRVYQFGSRRDRITPFSNKPTAFGACVFFATTNAIKGRRIPTKTHFAVADLPRRARHHQLAQSVSSVITVLIVVEREVKKSSTENRELKLTTGFQPSIRDCPSVLQINRRLANLANRCQTDPAPQSSVQSTFSRC